ncbi:helix-turn-helix domain-containing protein [Arenicella xantha]|uniref:AraC family transcriptional regulator n=1 Tax=Arenicella xantha TaxID=644221 RepID=A0A395JH09_9GAMM|nr:AraC family transcriptional regulator [Arenicella xantha]RBP47068.1 AraC family transcriptional regulator [Arenicella xantha]
MFAAIISALALGISAFSAHLLARRIAHSNVYLPLALFFAANAVVQFCLIVREPLVVPGMVPYLPEITLFKLVVELTLPPLFWIYVRELTSEHSRGWRKTDIGHFVVPLLPAVILALVVTVWGAGANSPTDLTTGQRFLGCVNAILNILALMQFCVYVVFLMVRLSGYRRKLMDLFASTEDLELNWFRSALWLIVINVGLELGAEILYALYGMSNPYYPWNGLARVAAIWFFAAWGLRQRPGLRIEIAKTRDDHSVAKKYEKSALSPEQLRAVSDKIRRALELDKQYRDENLSLRALSEQIGELPNYVSQALNTDINETFFDYVNRLRVLEAMERLKSTEDTVLMIANEVGFNSRSSFYSAFKKVTGQTPTAYRLASNAN